MKFTYVAAATLLAIGVFTYSKRSERNAGAAVTTSVASGSPSILSNAPSLTQAQNHRVDRVAGSQSMAGRVVVIPLEDILATAQVSDAGKEQIRRNVAAIQRGEPVVAAGSVPGLDKQIERRRNKLKSLQDIASSGQTRPPSDVSATSLHGGTLVGAYTTGTKTSNGWTGLGRVFQDPILGPVILVETDLNAGDSAKLKMPSETINIQIRDQPGSLSVLSDPSSGLSMTRLKWVDKSGVSYEMLTHRIDPSGKEALRQIAASIRP